MNDIEKEPVTIENILDANEMVQMSCVIGIPDAYRMQKVKAFVQALTANQK